MLVLPPRAIPQLAERVEQAYLRRRPSLHREYAHSPVWSAAAAALVALHRSDPSLPIDPELFVACQLEGTSTKRRADPWGELVHARATVRYRRQIQRMIRSLRGELRAELRLIDQRCRQGVPLERLLTEPNPRISALARFIMAYRCSGEEVLASLRGSVRQQHDACPLFRQVSDSFLPPHVYPVPEHLVALDASQLSAPLFSLN